MLISIKHTTEDIFLSGRHRIGTHALCVQHIPNCCGADQLANQLANRQPGRELDSVMEFVKFHYTIQLATWLTVRELVC